MGIMKMSFVIVVHYEHFNKRFNQKIRKKNHKCDYFILITSPPYSTCHGQLLRKNWQAMLTNDPTPYIKGCLEERNVMEVLYLGHKFGEGGYCCCLCHLFTSFQHPGVAKSPQDSQIFYTLTLFLRTKFLGGFLKIIFLKPLST